MVDEICESKQSVMNSFLSHYKPDGDLNDQWLHLFPVFALIIDYSDHLSHLNRLIESYKNHHTDDEHIEFVQDN
jgi:hypothetical protein